MDYTALKKNALKALQPFWGKTILVLLILYVSRYLFSIIEVLFFGTPVPGMGNYKYYDSPLYIDVIILLFLMPLLVGVHWYFLEIAKNNEPKIVDIFEPYKDIRVFFKVIGVIIFQSLFIFLWSLLLIVPGIIKAISYSQTFYILKEHPEMGIFETISASKNAMHGYAMKYVYVEMILSFFGWAFLALITLGIGLLFVFPYFTTTLAAFYLSRFDKGKVREIEKLNY